MEFAVSKLSAALTGQPNAGQTPRNTKQKDEQKLHQGRNDRNLPKAAVLKSNE